MSTLKTNAIQTVAGKPILNSTGSVIQTQYVSSGTRTAIDSTSFVEPSTNYRVSITPSSSSNIIILYYSIPSSANGQANTLYTIRAWREIGGGARSYSLTSAGGTNGSRNVIAGVTFRPNNGYDANDVSTQNFTVIDAPNTTSTCVYGFEFKRETGGTGTVYFGYSAADTSLFGFDTDILIVAQEVVA